LSSDFGPSCLLRGCHPSTACGAYLPFGSRGFGCRGGSRADRIKQLTQFINLRIDPSLLKLKTFDGCIDYFSGEFLWHVSSELRSNPFVFRHHFTSLAGEPDKQDQ
jgi:hypothetical protein